jgi:hypothetical protein
MHQRGQKQKIQALIKRLSKNRPAIFTFLLHPKVTPANNSLA